MHKSSLACSETHGHSISKTFKVTFSMHLRLEYFKYNIEGDVMTSLVRFLGDKYWEWSYLYCMSSVLKVKRGLERARVALELLQSR